MNKLASRLFGAVRRKPASARFDAEWYLARYSDVAACGMSPQQHYAQLGRSEGRYAYFDPEWYLREYSDVAGAGIDPLAHYMNFGRYEGRIPAFSPEWYISEYPDIAGAGVDPYEHYWSHGKSEGRHPAFDSEWYLAAYQDVFRANIPPLQHYVNFGRREGRAPRFDRDWYLEEYPDVRITGVDPYKHYLRHGKYESRHPAFDSRWYVEEYPDIAEMNLPYKHYKEHGRREKRHPAFHRHWYLTRYPDVDRSGIDPLTHYRSVGRQLGYKPAGVQDELRQSRFFDFPPAFESEYQAGEDFAHLTTDIKAIAFFLPQFHSCAQNDRWWGEGFTEWKNTSKSAPRFPGHYQPREPHPDIGYYDLGLAETLKKQAELARVHGIYGFCFYYYWFSGEKVLEKPLDILLDNPDIDINFCLCWANENWTRRWDGMDHDILIGQQYLNDDPEAFVDDIAVYLRDERYIRIGGRPVILVYKAHLIPDVERVFRIWRRAWRRTSGQELLIWCAQTNTHDHECRALEEWIDAVVEFPPHNLPHSANPRQLMLDQADLHLKAGGVFYDYQGLVDDILADKHRAPRPRRPFYRAAMLAWDNAARRQDGWSVWWGFSLKSYYKWLRHNVADARAHHAPDRRFIFLNAWNEWGEGAYLEPDKKTGYANLNTTSKAIFDLALGTGPLVLRTNRPRCADQPGRIAVQAHIFYEDLADELIARLNNIPFVFDVFLTTDAHDKAQRISAAFEQKGKHQRLFVCVAPNVGRDIGPFLSFSLKEMQDYDFIGHIHTKKSETVSWGDAWRRYLLDNLLGSTEGVRAIFETFGKNPEVGLIFPPAYPLIAPHLSWGDVLERCHNLLVEIGHDMILPRTPVFPAGNMFWARADAIRPIMEREWRIEEFEQEQGQIGQTLSHVVERIWSYAVAGAGYQTRQILLSPVEQPARPAAADARRVALFLHYDENGRVGDADLFLLQSLARLCAEVVVASNNELASDQLLRLRLFAQTVFSRRNAGLDFGAWRDCIRKIGWEQLREFDQVILVNNSCYGPLFPLREMFDAMREKEADFWGVTGFPLIESSVRPEAHFLPGRMIPRHVQSYFLVFERHVVASSAFQAFWESVEDKTDFMEVVTSYEAQLTPLLEAAGFKSGVYIPESLLMQEERSADPRFNAPYNCPLYMVELRSPFVKKKAVDYAAVEDIEATRNVVAGHGHYPAQLMFPGRTLLPQRRGWD
ncbi:MAG TPA: glycoside hydrolase family 99-like domain-containing protein [Methylocystis sp.]|nr:glycoside hydrolase family 99-like domain-containing protein [Methylocystis sp.]